MQSIRACIFDLDGVIVDTAKYHFRAWQRLAQELGFEFTEVQNERLKGVSRMRSLDILLEIGGVFADDQTKIAMAARKNEWYIEYISKMDESEILPGAKTLLTELRHAAIKTALGSASQNAQLIIQRIGMANYFDVIVDGTRVTKAKPDPEVFLLCASELGIAPDDCIVFEDAQAGIEASIRAGMRSVGIGAPAVLRYANMVVPSLQEMTLQHLTIIN